MAQHGAHTQNLTDGPYTRDVSRTDLILNGRLSCEMEMLRDGDVCGGLWVRGAL